MSDETTPTSTMLGVGLVLLFAALAAALLGVIAALAGAFNNNEPLLWTGLATMSMGAVFAFLSALLVLKSRGGD